MTILYLHPQYKRNYDEWVVAYDLYNGKHDIMSSPKYLWSHLIETKLNDPQSRAFRVAREERTRYLNIPEMIVSLWTSLFFKEDPILDPETNDLLEKTGGLENIDGENTHFFEFIKNKVLLDFLIYGKSIVLVDSFGSKPSNLLEEKELGFRPYMELLAPLSVVDWSRETRNSARLGKLNLLRHNYEYIPDRESAEEEPRIEKRTDVFSLKNGSYNIAKYRQVGATTNINNKQPEGAESIYKDGGDWAFIEEMQVTELKEIPISIAEDISWVRDLNQEVLRFHNLRSTKDNIELQQGYRQTFVKGIQAGDDLKGLSEYTMILLPRDADIQSLEPVSTEELRASLQESLDYCFKIGLNQLRSLPADSRENMGVDTIKEEKTNTVDLIRSTLRDLESLVNNAIKNYARFTGNDNFGGKVELNKEISDDDYTQFITVYNGFRDLLRSNKEVSKAATKKAIKLLQLDEEDETKALKEAETVKVELQKPDPIDSVLNGGQTAN